MRMSPEQRAAAMHLRWLADVKRATGYVNPQVVGATQHILRNPSLGYEQIKENPALWD